MSLIPFNKPALVGQELEFIKDAISRGQLSGDGHYTKLCNARLSALTDAPTALLTHSCTAALEMAAILTDLGPGDEVILPSFTFVSTANAVAMRGAIPVFVDIDPQTLNIDPEKVVRAVTPRTKAIIAVHYAGFAADMDPLTEIAQAHGLIVIEDAAQALGSMYKGRKCGALGDMAAFSFHETKNIISGEGGVITINRPDLVSRAEIVREKGTNRTRFLRGEVDKYTWMDIGSSFLPGELVAAFLYAQLEQSDEIKARRLTLYNTYWDAFSELEAAERIARPYQASYTVGNGHMFYLMMRDQSDRDRFVAHMKEQGITAPTHYVPLHSSPAGKRLSRTFAEPLAATEKVAACLVRLPMFYLLPDDQNKVIDIALQYFR